MVANTDRDWPHHRGVPRVVVIGAGPAGLIAAERLAERGVSPVIIEGSRSPARKFLIAGRGGLNLTHVGTVEQLCLHFGSEQSWLRPYLAGFDVDALRSWADGLGAETFIGTSGRVFPRALKATGLVRAWLTRLERLGVTSMLRTRLVGIGPGRLLRLDGPDGVCELRPDAVILAMGGASWPRLGSDGAWVPMLREMDVAVRTLRPANVGMLVPWSELARVRLQGIPLKNLAARAGDAAARGELVLTGYGVEGQLVYALGRALREELEANGTATLRLDLKPDLTLAQVEARLARPRGSRSFSTWLTGSLRLPAIVSFLLRELGHGPELGAAELARAIKDLPVPVTGTRPIAEAISSAGGVALAELDERLMLRRVPGLFVAGEMLDWEAPTGGYLLQACFSTGVAAAEGVLAWLTAPAGSCRYGPSSP